MRYAPQHRHGSPTDGFRNAKIVPYLVAVENTFRHSGFIRPRVAEPKEKCLSPEVGKTGWKKANKFLTVLLVMASSLFFSFIDFPLLSQVLKIL